MIDLKYGYMFIGYVRFAAAICFVFSLGIFTASTTGGIILFLVSLFVLTASEGTDINIESRTLREYNSFFFLKSGKFEPLRQVEYIFITTGKESYQMSSPRGVQTTVVENVVYNAYLKLSSGEKIKLLKEKDKNSLVGKLRVLSEKLPADIVDYSK